MKPNNRKLGHHERHGHAGIDARSPEYIVWLGMISRCTNPRHTSYAAYGGSGVKVCERWLNSFVAFLEDMGPRSAGTTLDREDGTKGYEPTNCRWATKKVQSRNRKDNVVITVGDRTATLPEWAESLGVGPESIRSRLRRGWPPADAVTVAFGGRSTRYAVQRTDDWRKTPRVRKPQRPTNRNAS